MWTLRLFKDNQARLQLFALAYNLGNFLRRLALPLTRLGFCSPPGFFDLGFLVAALPAGALQARFVMLADGSGVWPCDITAAHAIRLKLPPSGTPREIAAGAGGETLRRPHVLIASAEFEPSELQDLSDSVPRLLEIRAKAKTAIRFRVQVEVGDGAKPVDQTVVQEIGRILGEVRPGMELH